jgi:YggT family protein
VFVLANVLLGLARVLDMVLWLYTWLLIARAVVSWVNADPRNPIVRFLRMATDPLVELVRRLLPRRLRHYPVDIAFLALFGIVLFAQVALVQTLMDLGARLRHPVGAAPAP